MNRQWTIKSVLTFCMMLAVAGCGGGGSGSAGTTTNTGNTGVPGPTMGGAIQGHSLSPTGTKFKTFGTPGSIDGAGANARFSSPSDVVTDGSNLYVVDAGSSTVRKIVLATGATSTIAGSAWIIGSTDGAGAAARFNNPYGVAISADKATLFLSDAGNNTIRKIELSSGTVTTLAGSAGVPGAGNGIGAAARFNSPAGIATDGTNLFVADSINNTIRKIVIATGAVTTFAGNGAPSIADGTGAAARFNYPCGITTDGTNLYVADNGNGAIRKIVIATGTVSTLAEPGTFESPSGIATDGTNLYITDDARNVVRKMVISTQQLSVVAGDAVGGAPGSIDAMGGAARFNAPSGIVQDGNNLFVADFDGATVRKVDTLTGTVSTVAGTAGSADGTGPAAGFRAPSDICTDGVNLYVADTDNSTIRKIVIATGVVSTLAGTAEVTGSTDATGPTARFNYPGGITTDGINLYVADTDNHIIRKIVIATGAVSTVAGSAGAAGRADGIGSVARFSFPGGLTTDGTNLYVADTGNNAIRKIVLATGAVSTLVGSGAALKSPFGITTDGTNLYLADSGNKAVRKIAIASGAVTTVAADALFDFPTGITTDGTNLYVTDSSNRSVNRIVIATGAVTTVSTDFANPAGITTDGTGLYVADADKNVIVSLH